MPEAHLWRKSPQPPLPARKPAATGGYDIYPAFPLEAGLISSGYADLAPLLAQQQVVILDGFGGVLWERAVVGLSAELAALGVETAWQDVSQAWLPEAEIERRLEPYLGGGDPLFGTRYRGQLADFFDPERLEALQPDPDADLNILFGSGASLAGWQGSLVYLDVPKNEVQYRARAGSVTNLGMHHTLPAEEMYRRFYFADWVVLDPYRMELLPRIDYYIDEQRPDEVAWMTGGDLRAGLALMSQHGFRARPWFEPGIWGGAWCKEHLPQLVQKVPNYAWSFEFITPENGLIFESGGWLLEAPFDLLLAQAHRQVLGDCAERYGRYFPVRFNFLDTMRGGELAIQCHPLLGYIQTHFGERFTQDESYYILDCEPGSRVYLGFQEGIDPSEFEAALTRSAQQLEPLEIERFIHARPTQQHDYYLIPAATVHAAGVNNLVLEISATTYIFTFKLYDWLAKDLGGRLRPLHLQHGFANLNYTHTGEQIDTELVSQPELLDAGSGWRLVRLPTHPEHAFEVYRFEFRSTFEWDTRGSFNLMNLVSGSSITLETGDRHLEVHRFETFIAPAAAGSYRLVNHGPDEAWVVMACMKPTS
jgi:mannose-6-phosphate isomerase class I